VGADFKKKKAQREVQAPNRIKKEPIKPEVQKPSKGKTALWDKAWQTS